MSLTPDTRLRSRQLTKFSTLSQRRTVTINGTLNIQSFTTQTFGTLQGTGTLRISAGAFPTVLTALASNPFLQTGGGTVRYEGGAYTLPLPADRLQRCV
ncbi:MAG: hypothetical protein RML35_01275 [Chloroherpetonaceae bacterium]|nr:hypothetical protein [Chloroherpetonaceae bacterium]